MDLSPLELRTWYNSAFAFGMNDGPVWVGRGATGSASGGVTASWGPVSLIVAPVVFAAQNQRFAIVDNLQSGPLRFGDPLAESVDRPQRFGDAPYSRIDPGQSSLRFTGLGLTAGLSTADQWWGPMSEFPYVLGNNAGGFRHLFVGSSQSSNVWVGRVSWRVIYGDVPQSTYSPATLSGGRRFVSGAIAVFQPRIAPGLEIGGARFFHTPWPDSGLSSRYFTHLFEDIIKARIGPVLVPDTANPKQSGDNQLASIFFRWTPGSGFEVYGEYGREDHNWDTRDLIVELDHSAAVGIGVRKSWMPTPTTLKTLLVESMNFEASTLMRHRGEGGTYIHYYTTQGHTLRGQLLASGFAVGSGSGVTARLQSHRPGGSTSISVSRFAVLEETAPIDVQMVAEVRRTFLKGPRELIAGITGVYELNRYFAGDAFNWRFDVGVRYHPRLGKRPPN